MKKYTGFVIYLAVLSFLSGYLFSKASWIGRIGLSLFYKEYTFLKTWWKGALVVFIVLMVLFALQYLAQTKMGIRKARTIHIAAFLLALFGLLYTYNDFRSDITHRWMGERFHLGAYCFWAGWASISLLFLSRKRSEL